MGLSFIISIDDQVKVVKTLKIKEMETALGISKANIRFYEKEGLLDPKRASNGYREYTEEDLERLRTVIVLRKLGVSIENIKKILTHEESLQSVMQSNISELESKIEELEGALAVCRQIREDGIETEDFNAKYYLEKIENTEKRGGKFLDICKDTLEFEKGLWKIAFMRDYRENTSALTFKKVVSFTFFISLSTGIIRKFIFQGSFWEGFFYPLALFIICSVILFPIHILSKKAPKAAGVLAGIILIVSLLFLALIFGVLIVCLINAVFHFWW